jgi:hypothetical protein
MATTHANGADLLEAVQRLAPDEFDAFLEKALALRKRLPARRLSPRASRLIERINRGLDSELCERYEELSRKRKRKTLTADEHRELLQLTHEVETRDAERAEALLELSRLRRVPIRVLMRDMGIKAAPVHG